jgi:hypothetical protein
MNKIELMLVVEKILIKLFGKEGVLKITHNGNDLNKINFTVLVDHKKFFGCIFHSKRLTVKDVRNILFSYKKRVIQSLQEEVKNVDPATETVRAGVHQ